MNMKRLTAICMICSVIVIATLSGCVVKSDVTVMQAPSATAAAVAAPAKAKNVILFVGDGMGLAHVEAATYAMFGQELDDNMNPPKLSFVKFPVFGYITTHSADSLVTDSAAAGTALASGVKTKNGAIGVDANGTAVPSIAVTAKEKGKSVAVLSSVGLNHATPACFYGHSDSRGSYDEILAQAFAAGHLDVLMGGGAYGDGDLSKEAMLQRAAEHNVVYFDIENLAMLTPEFVKGYRVIGVFDANDNKQLDYEAEREAGNTEPHLSDLALLALDLVDDNPNGFFLMVEGGSIDWGGHANKFELIVGEVVEFDRAVGRVVKALKDSGKLDETLIIVTADHETGGLCIDGPYKKALTAETPLEAKFDSTNHTGIPVPVYAHGPGVETLGGKNDNTMIYRAMKAAME